MVLSNGSKYEGTVEPKPHTLGERIIRYGCEGPDVKLMQEYLVQLGYDLGRYGCDGDFGDCTDIALRAFQKDAHVDADGECGPITLETLKKAITALEDAKPEGQTVIIVGGNCYVRTSPSTAGKILGVARKGDMMTFAGDISETGWLLVRYKDRSAWVSGKYGKIE